MTYRCTREHRARTTFRDHLGKPRSCVQIVGENTRATVLERVTGVVTLAPEVDREARLTVAYVVFAECWEKVA